MKDTFKIFIIGEVLGLIIIVAIIIGGSLLASHRWDPTWNPFRHKDNSSSVTYTK